MKPASGEYLAILRRIWTSEGPVAHEGEYYHFANAAMELKPLQAGGIPISFAGASDAAIAVAARHAHLTQSGARR